MAKRPYNTPKNKADLIDSAKNPLEVRVDFKIGDMAVYPAHGVGIVEAIESKCFSTGRRNRSTS